MRTRPTDDATRLGTRIARRSARSWSRVLARLDAIVFAAAGSCTCATLLVAVDRDLATIAAVLGSMLTLAGLFILSFGVADERPLRKVPVAQTLLMTAAVAGVAQTVALQLRDQHVPGTSGSGLPPMLVPGIGLLGGCAVAAAVVALLAARQRHLVGPATLVGLSVIAVAAIATNGTAALCQVALFSSDGPARAADLLVHGSVVASGVGQLVIAVGFWRDPVRELAA